MTKPISAFSPLFTIITGFLCVVLMPIIQLIGIYLVSLWYFDVPTTNIGDLVIMGSTHGSVVAGSMVFTALFLSIFCYLMVYMKTKNHQHSLDFFAIKKVPLCGFLRHLGILLVFLIISEILMAIFDKSPMDFMQLLINHDTLIPMIIATTIIVPIYEEVIFRGFIVGAINNTTLSLLPTPIFLGMNQKECLAIVISSLLFAIVHLQYDVFGMVIIFLMALLFGYARIKYGLLLTILLHIINNSLAMAMYLYLTPLK